MYFWYQKQPFNFAEGVRGSNPAMRFLASILLITRHYNEINILQVILSNILIIFCRIDAGVTNIAMNFLMLQGI